MDRQASGSCGKLRGVDCWWKILFLQTFDPWCVRCFDCSAHQDLAFENVNTFVAMTRYLRPETNVLRECHQSFSSIEGEIWEPSKMSEHEDTDTWCDVSF